MSKGLFMLWLAWIICCVKMRKPLSLHSFSPAISERFTTIAIVATNDIHGAVFPTHIQRTDTFEEYTQGGLALLGTMIHTIRKQFGEDHVLYLDAGDQFQGHIESGPLISKG
jgi:2',3'-cyclic-nucleotide 2'-phosphodiesterase (5'-nucleotidase family)